MDICECMTGGLFPVYPIPCTPNDGDTFTTGEMKRFSDALAFICDKSANHYIGESNSLARMASVTENSDISTFTVIKLCLTVMPVCLSYAI